MENALADRTGVRPLAQQGERHGRQRVLAFEEAPRWRIEAGGFADAGGRHQIMGVGPPRLRMQDAQHALLRVDVADENREVDAEFIFFFLQDALAAPVKGAGQHYHERQDAEQRGIQAAGSARHFS
ncbi:hypothetical protein D9M68_819400 [compost metagenome]